MSNKNPISRRKFLGGSAVGISSLGLGISRPSELLANPNSSGSDVDKDKISPRVASVLSLTMHKINKESPKKIVDQVLKRLEIMSSYNPDVICLPEGFATKVKDAETIPGAIVNAFTDFAKQHSCYIICPLHTKKNNKVFNTAVLIDRQGKIVGQYDKIHPNEFECDDGICPGAWPPQVFKTDFGVIGIQICFDFNWIDDWKYLKEQGAEIIFWPSAYPGGRMLSGLAWLYKYYVVGSSNINPALIYDMSGDLISESGRWESYAFATLNLEKILCEVDFNVPKVKDIRKKYENKVHIKFYHNEDWLTIESRSPDVTIKQLVEEFDLTQHWDYIKRAGKYQDKFRI